MEVNFVRPIKTLSILSELEKVKRYLNLFEEEKQIDNFLNKNNEKYNVRSKVDLILHNFEKNTLFLYSDKNIRKIFDFLDKSKLEQKSSESLIYKMYLYFYGYIEENRLRAMLIRYSGNKIKTFDFKNFIRLNKKKLFKEHGFPKVLNNGFKSLKEIVELIEEEPNIYSYLNFWEENFLGYLNDKELLKKIEERIVKKLGSNISYFFTKNKKVKIQNITLKYESFNNTYYKIISIKLEKDDKLNFIKKLNVRNKLRKDIIYFSYEKRNQTIQIEKIINKENILNTFSLDNALKTNYSLNKIYLFKQKIRKIFIK